MRAAMAEVRRAETLATMPAVREAAVTGRVTVEHVDVVARIAAGASVPVRETLGSDQGQATLVELARRIDAGQFARSVALWAAGLDAGAHERDHQAQRAARFLHLADTDGGTRISGQLDRMAGHRLRLALEAASGRPGVDDDRTSEQRRADALGAIAEKVLSLPDTGSGAAVRPHISFVMTERTWAGLRALRGVAAASGEGGAAAAPVPPVTLEDGTPVPISEVAQALCDYELTRVVMGAGSEPLDLGRTQRTYTGAQRRAVIARDGGCAWPSCDRPARWCEVHHIRWWDRDRGATSVQNGVLLCSFHHHEVHRQDLSIRRRPGDDGLAGYVFARPDGRVLAPAGHDSRPPDLGPPGVRPSGGRTPDLRPPGATGTERPPDVRRPGALGSVLRPLLRRRASARRVPRSRARRIAHRSSVGGAWERRAMEILVGIITLAVGLLAGWALAATRAETRVRRAEVRAVESRALLEAERRVAAERVAAAQADRTRLNEQFRALAADALRANSEQFMVVAEERLKRSQEAGAAELSQREDAVKQLVEPLTRTLDQVKNEVLTAERARLQAQSALAEQLRGMRESSDLLRSETTHLVTALRSSQVRGRWGEIQLRSCGAGSRPTDRAPGMTSAR